MPKINFDGIKISGLSCALPNNKILTKDLKEHFSEDELNQFIKTSGVKSRYYAKEKQTASDLCYTAAKNIMEHKGFTGNDIDAVVFISQNFDYIMPATSFVLHKRLGLKEDCMVFDINLGCSAFVNGVYLLASMIKSGSIKKALLLIGNALKPHEFSSRDSLLFGDAGTALLIEEGNGNIKGMIKSDGSGYNAIIMPGPAARYPFDKDNTHSNKFRRFMKGDDVFLFTITKVPKLFKEFFKEYNCSIDNFDYCILHQANMLILNHISKKLKIPHEKMPVSLPDYGNTEGVTIPLTIADLCERENTPEKLKLITSGFGVGLNWGIVSFEINRKDVLPITYTDEYFEESFLDFY